jgi:hypothetical protein
MNVRSTVVGSRVRARQTSAVCDAGEAGVVYEVYARGDGSEGISVIFASGRYDGFSPAEIERFLEVSNEIVPGVAGYAFRSALALERDFAAGVFDAALAR